MNYDYKYCDDDDIMLNFKDLESTINEICDSSELKEMLNYQLGEIEMLQSMFPNPGEFCVDDVSIIADMNNFVEGKSTLTPAHLDFTINLLIDNIKFHIHVYFAHEYPACEPEVFVRSEKLSRIQQNKINSDVISYVKTLDRGEICIGSVISWLQENVLNYVCHELTQPEVKSDKKQIINFARYWIYTHHIYSKIKRREIMELALEHTLTGFSMPGRPGIICIEGSEVDCSEWWQKIRSMAWKKIICKKIETVAYITDVNKYRKFDAFDEITFETPNLKHMDMGEFFKYLEKKQCSYIFKEYFGIEGKKS